MKRKFKSIKVESKEPIKIELGCGKNKTSGYMGIDIEDNEQDIVWDVRQGIPFPDSSIDEVYSCHFLEHLNQDEVQEVFREVFRVLKNEGIFFNRVPYGKDDTAFYICHKTFWIEATVSSMCVDAYQGAGLWHFEVLRNERIDNQLYFKLKAIK